jgi:guanine nucleotide-binding protein G(i) subunit alpha
MCGGNQTDEQKELKKRNAEIENNIKKDKAIAEKEIKMLLLGAGESGKSTILKQMTLIYGKPFTEAERASFKEIIFSNVVQSMRAILEAMSAMSIALATPDNEASKTLIMNLPSQIEADDLPADVTSAIKKLWADAGVLSCFDRSREYQLNDSAKYYFDAMDRIGLAGYSPTEQDVLRSRVKTTGITETSFSVGDLTYRMFDVGGQRSERKKWIHCFENVTSIVFLAACSEYDQMLVEDETMNRMTETLNLFESICNSKWFVETSLILFLNKVDLFKQKIVKSHLGEYFPDYTGPNEFEPASEFLVEKFTSLNKNTEKQIYSHFTCATDTSQVKFVMAAVNDIIVRGNLKDAGLV